MANYSFKSQILAVAIGGMTLGFTVACVEAPEPETTSADSPASQPAEGPYDPLKDPELEHVIEHFTEDGIDVTYGSNENDDLRIREQEDGTYEVCFQGKLKELLPTGAYAFMGMLPPEDPTAPVCEFLDERGVERFIGLFHDVCHDLEIVSAEDDRDTISFD